MKKTRFFYCLANGLAQYGFSVPDGAFEIMRFTPKKFAIIEHIKAERNVYKHWKYCLEANCNLSDDKKSLIIPGIEERKTDDQNKLALIVFLKRVSFTIK